MIVPPPKSHRSLDDSILPLINVVFLLLIFFVIAGVITRSAPFDLTLPTTTRAEDRALPDDQILAVGADGQLAFAGKTINTAELGELLTDWPVDTALQIRADSGLRADALSELLGHLRAVGVAQVRLLTQHQPE